MFTGSSTIHYCKVFDSNGTLVRYYIPAKRNSDDVLGMYEVKTGIFLTNQGTGTFTAGSEISETSNEYIPVEYIESTGTQYINTRIILSSYTNPKLVFTGYLKNTNTGIMMLGAYNSTTPPHIFFINGNDSVTNVVIDYDNYTQIKYELPFNPLSKHTYYCKYNNSSMKFALAVDTEDYTQYEEKGYSGLTSVYPLYLFGRNTAGTTALSETVFYGFKFYNGNTILHNFIPVKRKSDDVPGLFDTISREFYTNAGTGDFIAGPEFQYVEAQYVEATGSQYADTNIIPDSNSKIEAKFSLNSLNATQCLVGTRNFSGLGYNAFSIFSDYYDNNSNNMRFDYDNDWKLSIEPLVNVNYTVAKAQEKNYINGSETTSNTQSTFSCTNSLYVFSLHSTENPFYMNGKLYYLKIWNGEDLVANIIPIKRKSDDTGFLYNTINHELLIYNDVLVAGPIKSIKSVSPGVPAKIVKINLPTVRKYQLLDRVVDDSNNDIGIVTGFFNRPKEVTETYTQLEYLELNGRNCFNTNLYLSKGMDIEYEFMMHDLALTDQKSLGGARNGGAETGFQFAYNGKNLASLNTLVDYFGGNGDSTGRWSVKVNGDHYALEDDIKYKFTIINKIGTFYKNGTIIDTHTYNAGGTSPVTVPLFINTNNNNGTWGSVNNHWNFYHFKVTGSTPGSYPVADIVPVKRNSDNRLGLYDKVNRRFLETLGDGTLTAGPETNTTIVEPASSYTRLEYIDVNNDFIDTQLYLHTNNTVSPVYYPNIHYTFSPLDYTSMSINDVLGCRTDDDDSYGDFLLGSNKTNNNVYIDYFDNNGETRYTHSGGYLVENTKYRLDIVSRTASLTNVDTSTQIFSHQFGTSTTKIWNSLCLNYLHEHRISVSNIIEQRIYDLEIENISHMVPAKRNSDNVIGMYDLVRNKFFTISGVGTITGGPVVEPIEIPTEYAVVCLNASERARRKSMFQDNTTKIDGIPTLSIHDSDTIFELPQTATENCSAILYTGSSDAVSYCRSKTYTIDGVTYQGQVPNAIELKDIYLHATEVNANDPTASSYGDYTLANGSNIRSQWSSTQTNQWSGDLPSVYTELSYLQSSGYIYLQDTTLKTPTSGKIQMKVQINTGNGGTRFIGWCNSESGSSQDPNNVPIMIASDGSYNNLYYFYGNSNQANIDTANTTYGINMNVYQSGTAYNYITYIFEPGQQKLYMNGYLVGTSSRTNQLNAYDLRLFCASNTTSYVSVVKIYECKIFDENGKLLRNYVPAKRNSDNEYGMYDTVTRRFIAKGSGSTGSFTGDTKSDAGISSIAIRNYGFNGIENNKTKDRSDTIEIITAPVLEIPNLV